MSTLDRSPERNPEVRISGDAVDLLQCFMSGIDDVVMRIALSLAERRLEGEGKSCSSGQELRVEGRDVKEAAFSFFEHILSREDLPPDVKQDIREMEQCLKAKCHTAP